MLRFNFVQSTDAASDEYAVAIGITRCKINRRLSNGFVGRDEGELTKTIDTSFVFRVEVNIVGGTEVANFAAESDFEVAAVEPLNGPDTASSGTHCVPDIVQNAAQRCDDAETRHYNSTT